MNAQSCPTCHATDHVTNNTTNYAAKYHCSACDRVFDPDSWKCPRCEDDERVASNPFDDPADYYCYRCDLAFNRLGFEFDPERVRYEALVDSGARLTFDVETRAGTTAGVIKCLLTLENVGSTTVETLGPASIAIQQQVSDTQWWTIHGNPDEHTIRSRVPLEAGEALRREFAIRPDGIRGEGISINREPLPSGTYRILYWGLPETEDVIAERLTIEFDHGW